ncbi:MAG: MarR family winged helix-turn-helix transcriptional regulator [Roseburia sp.]|nr:MarR family winged helix-turn-helix transcriptional regulator [Roseburia sp.]
MDEKEFFYRLGKLVYQIDGVYDEYGRNSKIGSPNLLWILYALGDNRKHSQRQICDDWAIPRSTANTIVKDLQSKGYVRLTPIKGERRELLISLTDTGKVYADNILSDLYRREKEIYKSIDNAETLLADLENLATKMRLIGQANSGDIREDE